MSECDCDTRIILTDSITYQTPILEIQNLEKKRNKTICRIPVFYDIQQTSDTEEK